ATGWSATWSRTRRAPWLRASEPARAKACLAGSEKSVGWRILGVVDINRSFAAVAESFLPPGPGVAQDADLRQGDPEADHRGDNGGGRDPGEGLGLQLVRPLPDLAQLGFVMGD